MCAYAITFSKETTPATEGCCSFGSKGPKNKTGSHHAVDGENANPDLSP